jgi:exodeoxyribonuclease-1
MSSTDTLYFYDLETTGFSPRDDRIMQFAGQRTDLDLNPVGEPHNIIIKLSEDILPSPQAILLTGITPQQTIADGVTESEFLNIFHSEIATAGTTFVGFNNIRFDDEFTRFINYRNFHDPYEWHWSNGRSRWDMLDVVRMTRALRPDGIKWPFASNGRPSNRLEELSTINKLTHDKAHDALSDVYATIELAKLIKSNQPDLFDHLYEYRAKKGITKLVGSGDKFVYSSGRYSSEYLQTTVAIKIADHPNRGGALVYDLRTDPKVIKDMSTADMLASWTHRCREYPCPHPKFPVKTLQYNRCPAVAPYSVLDNDSIKNTKLQESNIEANLTELNKFKSDLVPKILEALEQKDAQQAELFSNDKLAEAALYDNFISDDDKMTSRRLLTSKPGDLLGFLNKFEDSRLKSLLPIYITKNHPKVQTDELRQRWEKYKAHKLMEGGQESRAAKYFKQLGEVAESSKLSDDKRFLLEELQLWGQSILPAED